MKPIKIGMIGLGTVGTGVARFLLSEESKRHGLQLKTVSVSDPKKPRKIDFKGLTTDTEAMLADPEIDIIVELMGGESPALGYIDGALKNGKCVVTANKVVVSKHIKHLFHLATSAGQDLAFEAAVAGSIPIIRILRAYVGERITKVTGILNGTSNYILSRMEEGMEFEKALGLAQEMGFAEAEHLLDTGGFDARDKLSIIASLAFNTAITPEDIYCEGITEITPIDLDFAAKHGLDEGSPGYRVKSLASASLKDGKLELHVYPALISADHPLAAVRDETNAVYLEGERCGPQLLQGLGAGENPTASAVIADILEVAHNRRCGVINPLPDLGSTIEAEPIWNVERRGYVRLNLKHIPGSIAEASRIMGEHHFNIEDSIQRRQFRARIDGEVVIPDIVTVEPLSFGEITEGLSVLRNSSRVLGKPFYLRFEG